MNTTCDLFLIIKLVAYQTVTWHFIQEKKSKNFWQERDMNTAHELDCLKEAHAWALLFPWLPRSVFSSFFSLSFTGWQFQIPFTGQEFHYRDRIEQATTKSIIIKKTSESRRGNWRGKCTAFFFFFTSGSFEREKCKPCKYLTLYCKVCWLWTVFTTSIFLSLYYLVFSSSFTPMLCQCKYMYYLKPFKVKIKVEKAVQKR